MNKTQGLPDVQALHDKRGISLDNAGIKGVEMPLRIKRKNGSVQDLESVVELAVGLGAEDKGVHMSRFVEQLAEWSRDKTIDHNLAGFLRETIERLDAESAFVGIDFNYFMERPAPVSSGSAPMAYRCRFESKLETSDDDVKYQALSEVRVPVATLCPCSKEISDYGAHNQRAEILARVILDTDAGMTFWIEDLIVGLENCASCPVYPLLKRSDEKYVTERQYNNPKFVEDVARESVLFLREFGGVLGFSVEVEALESIHAHNAWAAHTEKFKF